MTNNKYDSIRRMFGDTLPNLAASGEDLERAQAALAYENLYWNRPETFKLVQRGDDSEPMYIPSARKLVESTNRFLAVDWNFLVTKAQGSSAQQKACSDFMTSLFRREKVYTKFGSQRRFGLVRGDAFWHLLADRSRPAGRRLSVQDVHPNKVFPIYDADDPLKVVGYHLVDLVADFRDKKKSLARRQTYRRVVNSENAYVTSELSLYEIGKWDDRYLERKDLKLIKILKPEFVVEGITSLPVYHVPNGYSTGDAFGSSELRGIETVIAGVNQSLSDEHLALIMSGLGVYFTTAGPPLDSAGNEVDWEIGPSRVLEGADGSTMQRISGVTSVEPMISHMNFALDEAQVGIGVPDIATGKVDVAVAESGISLRLQLAPLLAKNAEKEQDMLGEYDQMFFDLTREWMPTYEDFADSAEVEVVSVVGDAMPVDRAATVTELIALLTPPATGKPALITLDMAIAQLTKLGYEYPANAAKALQEEADKIAQQTADPFGDRVNQELNNNDNNGDPNAADK